MGRAARRLPGTLKAIASVVRLVYLESQPKGGTLKTDRPIWDVETQKSEVLVPGVDPQPSRDSCGDLVFGGKFERPCTLRCASCEKGGQVQPHKGPRGP